MSRDSTIKDVARVANVSVTTVSRVLNTSAQVSAPTRKKVLETAKRLQFIPSRAAIALVTRRTRTIGIVIPYLGNSIYSTMVHEIDQTLSRNGYFLTIALSNDNSDGEVESARRLLAMGAEALILSGADHNGNFLRSLAEKEIPAVFTSVWDPNAACPTIGYDNYSLAQVALKHLEMLGHRRIAVLHGKTSRSDRTRARILGIKEGKAKGTSVAFFEGDMSAEAGAQAMRAALGNMKHVTAVIGLSDVIALGAIFEARRQGIALPNELSIMGFDNLAWSNECSPRLTTLSLPTVRMGRAAAEALVWKLEGQKEISPMLLHGELIVRESTTKPFTR